MNGRAEFRPDTLFVGAPTRLGHALNDFVRLTGKRLRESGVSTCPNKQAIHALRSAIGDNPDRKGLEEILDTASGHQLYLSALFALGRPGTALRDNELFPEAERMLAAISQALEDRMQRIVLAIEPVHHLLLSVGRDEVVLTPARARWEALYEVSWAELVDVVSGCFEAAELVVLTPHAARNGAAPMLHHLFGAGGFDLASQASGEAMVEICASAYEQTEIKEKIGLDRVACDLLEQRFREDVDAIAMRPRVRVF